MTLCVVDYGMGNLGSLTRALTSIGVAANVVDDPRAITSARAVILPGVGAFAEGMAQLEARGWIVPLREAVTRGASLMGICLGMQLFADVGCEGGRAAGLGLIPGRIERLTNLQHGERLPHVGWNAVHHAGPTELFREIPDGADFYFVHSYHFLVDGTSDVIATTPYGGGFSAAVQRGRVFGVQFHPEKSSHFGRQLLKNFVALAC